MARVDTTQKQVAMVSAVTELLKVRKTMKDFETNEAMKRISPIFSSVRDSASRALMVAAVSKAGSLIEKNRSLTDKEVINQTVREFPNILAEINFED
jgi:hypothetical protein